ncbi:aldehyde dehydrogenase (NADP(+)) [Croceicoccus sediminis]|uniref:aldehyde dehydrogenase (NADP(+)) n=1 Tax=Croceicoccus sediminis TaxID=2571150 RepID=UPI001183DC5D|nr:aldehyde dehydrogenase (NADP(+)) [Croceicoccus sediminis]
MGGRIDGAASIEAHELSGKMLVAGRWTTGRNATVRSCEAATGRPLDPEYPTAGAEEIEAACSAAEADFDDYRERSPADRARFLEAIATEIEALEDRLIVRVMAESGLPRMRLEGERGRTCNQLRMFANHLRQGTWDRTRHDEALPDRQPAPRPELYLRHIAIGPVAVFGASNFPLAFSVAGGDTASALAAGCPVIVKAHPAHLGTSELVARAVDRARQACDMPPGVFSMLIGADNDFGAALVTDHRIKAVGFTGSRSGGLALVEIAARRTVPIPVYAEMSSINPVILFPGALDERGAAIAEEFAASLNLGVGQFCTNPGLLLAIESPALDRFIQSARAAIAVLPAGTMLTPMIHGRYDEAVQHRRNDAAVVAEAEQTCREYEAGAILFEASARDFLASERLGEEIFGPASLLVRCHDESELREVIDSLEGQLTIAIHLASSDLRAAGSLMPVLERKAGRILANGFGTGVEVADAMVHGGPFPATSDGRSTSVGSLAIDRFLRPVCYQDIPERLFR